MGEEPLALFTLPQGGSSGPLTATADWGDGTTSGVNLVNIGGDIWEALGGHAYAALGEYAVRTVLSNAAGLLLTAAVPEVDTTTLFREDWYGPPLVQAGSQHQYTVTFSQPILADAFNSPEKWTFDGDGAHGTAHSIRNADGNWTGVQFDFTFPTTPGVVNFKLQNLLKDKPKFELSQKITVGPYPPTLSFSTVAGYPKALPFGVFSYPGTFNLSSPSEDGGFVLQHVRRTVTERAINAAGVTTYKPLTADYWEVLQVYEGDSGPDPVRFIKESPLKKDLTDYLKKNFGTSNISDDFEDDVPLPGTTRGTVVQIGEAYYVDGLDWHGLPGGAAAWPQQNLKTNALDLPSQQSSPALSLALENYFEQHTANFSPVCWHLIVANWTADGTTTVQTSPGDLDAGAAKKLEGSPTFP